MRELCRLIFGVFTKNTICFISHGLKRIYKYRCLMNWYLHSSARAQSVLASGEWIFSYTCYISLESDIIKIIIMINIKMYRYNYSAYWKIALLIEVFLSLIRKPCTYLVWIHRFTDLTNTFTLSTGIRQYGWLPTGILKFTNYGNFKLC